MLLGSIPVFTCHLSLSDGAPSLVRASLAFLPSRTSSHSATFMSWGWEICVKLEDVLPQRARPQSLRREVSSGQYGVLTRDFSMVSQLDCRFWVLCLYYLYCFHTLFPCDTNVFNPPLIFKYTLSYFSSLNTSMTSARLQLVTITLLLKISVFRQTMNFIYK